MKSIYIRNVRDEVISFVDRQASELSKISGRNITRNAYINLILEQQLRDDLSVIEDKYAILNEKFDLLTEVITEEKQSTKRLIGLIVHGGDIGEE